MRKSNSSQAFYGIVMVVFMSIAACSAVGGVYGSVLVEFDGPRISDKEHVGVAIVYAAVWASICSGPFLLLLLAASYRWFFNRIVLTVWLTAMISAPFHAAVFMILGLIFPDAFMLYICTLPAIFAAIPPAIVGYKLITRLT